jgi:hypothetical protein
MKYLSSIYIVFLLLTSCDSLEVVIDIDLPEHEPLLVVNSVNKVSEPWKVFVSFSHGPLDAAEFEFITDADVRIYEGQTIVSRPEYSSSCNCFLASESPESNKNYRIEVSHPSYPTATTDISVPVLVPILSITNNGFRTVEGEESLAVDLEFSDPQGANYYQIDVRSYPSMDKLYYESSDPAFGDSDFGSGIIFNDQLFDATIKKLGLNIYYFNFFDFEDESFSAANDLDSISISLISISEEFYLYETTRRLQNNGDGALFFGAEPVNVFNSFLNEQEILTGYGIFSVNQDDTKVFSVE